MVRSIDSYLLLLIPFSSRKTVLEYLFILKSVIYRYIDFVTKNLIDPSEIIVMVLIFSRSICYIWLHTSSVKIFKFSMSSWGMSNMIALSGFLIGKYCFSILGMFISSILMSAFGFSFFPIGYTSSKIVACCFPFSPLRYFVYSWGYYVVVSYTTPLQPASWDAYSFDTSSSICSFSSSVY